MCVAFTASLCVYREKDSEKNGAAYENGHRDLSATTKKINKINKKKYIKIQVNSL